MNDSEKAKFITKHHTNGDHSIQQLAEFSGTYSNKIKRDAKRLKIKTDTKSEAQSKAMRTGAIAHPTKGKKRPDSVKAQIGVSRRETWKDISDVDRAAISKIRKKQYKEQRKIMAPHLAPAKVINLQKAAKEGSKIERYVFKHLSGIWDCVHQHEGLLGQETYHIDIFIRELKIAIEIDGPAHYEQIWSASKLKTTKEKDLRKSALINSAGYTLIRFIADKKFSNAYAIEAAAKIEETCIQITKKKIMKEIVYVKI